MSSSPERPSWRVAARSVRGVSHIKSNLPCQDAVEWACPHPALLLAAVADGAGSARESKRGATIACRASMELLKKHFRNGSDLDSADRAKAILKDAFEASRNAVIAEADQAKLPVREFASTLMLMAASRESAFAIQIGDGATLLLNSKDELSALTQPPETEHLNETFFLIMDNALEFAQIKHWTGELKGAAMFTDGLQMLALKMPQGEPHQPFFTPLFKFVAGEANQLAREEQFQKFLTSPRITQRADDDLTLLIATLQER